MDRSDHKLTIHRTPTTHRKKSLHQIDFQEHQGEHCIEDQKDRRSHLATSCKDDEEPLRDRFTLRQSAGKGL